MESLVVKCQRGNGCSEWEYSRRNWNLSEGFCQLNCNILKFSLYRIFLCILKESKIVLYVIVLSEWIGAYLLKNVGRVRTNSMGLVCTRYFFWNAFFFNVFFSGLKLPTNRIVLYVDHCFRPFYFLR